MAEKEAKKEIEVKISDMIEVVGTAKAKFIRTGRKTELHRVQAERLAKLGYVTIVK